MSNSGLEEVKVVLIGESGVGKSSIIKQYLSHVFDPDIVASISSKVVPKTLEIKDMKRIIKFNIWDTAGQEKYRSIAKIFYKDAKIIIFVYSIVNKESFESLKTYWLPEVKSSVFSDVIFAVVGNKYDLYNNSQVSDEEARNWADSIGAIFQYTSAKSNSGIDLLFENLARKFFDPEFDYKKGDEEAKKFYEMKKKEKENKKNEEDDDAVKMPNLHNITLTKKDFKEIEDTNKNKRKCC
jgi:small GTP-binding protein